MPRTDAPAVAGGPARRTDLGGMAVEVKSRDILKCFTQTNAMTLLRRLIEIVLCKPRAGALVLARQEAPSRPENGDRSGAPAGTL